MSGALRFRPSLSVHALGYRELLAALACCLHLRLQTVAAKAVNFGEGRGPNAGKLLLLFDRSFEPHNRNESGNSVTARPPEHSLFPDFSLFPTRTCTHRQAKMAATRLYLI